MENHSISIEWSPTELKFMTSQKPKCGAHLELFLKEDIVTCAMISKTLAPHLPTRTFVDDSLSSCVYKDSLNLYKLVLNSMEVKKSIESAKLNFFIGTFVHRKFEFVIHVCVRTSFNTISTIKRPNDRLKISLRYNWSTDSDIYFF